MKASFEKCYGADRDGNRGVSAWFAELDDSLEEREEIAEKVFKEIIEGEEVNLERFNVTLSIVEYSNCTYSEQYDETFCDENEVEFEFCVSPIDYMDLVIPMVIEQIDDDWGVDEMSCLLYLERDLIDAGYTGKELAQLSKAVEPFREKWARDFSEELKVAGG